MTSTPELVVIDDFADTTPFPQVGMGHHTALAAPDARVIVLTFAAGHVLKEHSAPHPLHLQVLAGEVLVRVDGTEVTARPGGLIRMAAHLRHEVEALNEARILLTLVTADSER